MPRACWPVVLAVALLTPAAVRAQAGPQLRYDLELDAAVSIGGGALWIGSELLKGSLAPRACNWCDRSAGGGDTLNGLDDSVRNALRASDVATADAASNWLGFAGMPLIALGGVALVAHHDDRLRNWPVDALIIVEAVIIAADLNQITKLIIGRERPFVHALPAASRGLTSQPSDNNLSFFSGHTTLAFALAAASGTVASMRRYRLAPLIWIVGMTAAAFTGYLRIAADRHYFTDVLVGALIGGGLGAAIPYVFHRPTAGPTLALLTGQGALGLTLRGAF